MNLRAGSGGVILSVAGSLLDSDANTDIAAGDVVLTTGGNIGTAVNPIALSVSSLTTSSPAATLQHFTTASSVTIASPGLVAPQVKFRCLEACGSWVVRNELAIRPR